MRYVLLAALALSTDTSAHTLEQYGFIARLGTDTVSVERVTRRENTISSDEVDRFPSVRQRHTEITLGPDGGIQRLTMDVVTPSEPVEHRHLHVVAEVSRDSVIMTKRDGAGARRWAFATGGAVVVAHVPQMYSLYELYFSAGLQNLGRSGAGQADTFPLRQFYPDREFDRFPLHRATVRRRPRGTAEVWHDWLAGVGEATVDSTHRMLSYSGARTTYRVEVRRVTDPPDVAVIGAAFAAAERKSGVKELSVRDTVRARIGPAALTIDYGRPRARGRQLLGSVIPYGDLWRTGANAATQFTTTAPLTLAGIALAPGTYTLWTVPSATGADLVINAQHGQWGTQHESARDVGRNRMQTRTNQPHVEQFTMSLHPTGDRSGTLTMEWGPFRWDAPIAVTSGERNADQRGRRQ